MSQPLTITQLVSTIKGVLESHPDLSKLESVGEISNLTKSQAGHWYFSLKDSKSKINCVMFGSSTLRLSTDFQVGDEVLIQGYVSVYTASGQVQIIVTSMSLYGQGALYKKYLELRDLLHKQGYFNQSHKKPIPKYPEVIGVIVGANSAAQADILQTLKSRWPIAKIKMYESLVQGISAPRQLIEKLKEADQGGCDVVILARGGGSIEDLWAFNDVELVMSIFEMKTPVITGVGHEIDITLVDYVADLRGLTPTDAAVHATPDQREVFKQLLSIDSTLVRLAQGLVSQNQRQLNQLVDKSVLNRPNILLVNRDYQLRELRGLLDQFYHRYQMISVNFDKLQAKLVEQNRLFRFKTNQKLSSFNDQMLNKLQKQLNHHHHKIDLLQQELALKSPHRLLDKGYLISYQNDLLIKSIKDINPSIPLKLVYRDGQVLSRVEENNE